jgi:hypothetical protein
MSNPELGRQLLKTLDQLATTAVSADGRSGPQA